MILGRLIELLRDLRSTVRGDRLRIGVWNSVWMAGKFGVRDSDGVATMTRTERWIQNFADCFPRRVIGPERRPGMAPLLVRYFVFRSDLLGIYLHRLCRSDEDRALHDHPWTFVSVILSGGYIEHTPTGPRSHRAGAILYRPAEWQHRLELTRPAWTVVFRFQRKREWGFWCPQGWIHWQQFDKQGGCE